ncbi:MAG: PsiF family protein [Pseudolabrys sp.]
MIKFVGLAAAAVALSVAASAPAAAVSAKDKMATCKFGADDQKLQGKARTSFMAKCMGNEKRGGNAPAVKPAAAKPAG